MPDFHCWQEGRVCLATTKPMSDGGGGFLTQQLVPGETEPIVLTAPVGEGSRAINKFRDVVAIQRGFNKLLPEDRGFLAPLVDDGICGPKTKRAIHSFQLKHFGIAGADVLMEPGKQTITKLNELIRTKAFVPATLEDYARALGLPAGAVRAAIAESMQLAQQWIRATHLRLVTPLPYPLLDKYFLMDRQPSPAQVRNQVSAIVSRMRAFFERPGGLFGEAAFVPEPVIRPTETTAWTQPGGFFATGETAFIPVKNDANLVPVRSDTIYFTTRFILKTVPQRAYTIVHELGHFVSRAPAIRDRVYAHRDFESFTKLSAADRISNTDHYTMLAFEQGTGQTRPPQGL